MNFRVQSVAALHLSSVAGSGSWFADSPPPDSVRLNDVPDVLDRSAVGVVPFGKVDWLFFCRQDVARVVPKESAFAKLASVYVVLGKYAQVLSDRFGAVE